METAERMRLIRLIEKISENQAFSKKIGVQDTSVFRKPDRRPT